MRLPGKRFQNLHPHSPHNLSGVLRWKLGLARQGRSSQPSPRPAPRDPIVHSSDVELSTPPAKERIRLTWIGHSTFLVQHQGRNILTDPIFGNCQPLPIGGLRRSSPPGLSFDSLPPIHDVIISHSHYDHLDAPTIRALGNRVRYWVPTGLSGWFRKRGINSCQDLGWWESGSISEQIAIHSVPAQHASGRGPFDRDKTLWCGWVLQSSERSIYFAGDTGYSPSFREIGQKFGGFDLAMVPIGGYEPRWLMQPMHLNPAEAVQAHIDIGSSLSVACHWGTFRMTDEPLNEPPEVLARELSARNIDPEDFRVLRVGETLEL
ncbi:MAG TPA: MBL fold metallo-hydrolase [Terriglobales bacterium]